MISHMPGYIKQMPESTAEARNMLKVERRDGHSQGSGRTIPYFLSQIGVRDAGTVPIQVFHMWSLSCAILEF